jgi:hypothetical protein
VRHPDAARRLLLRLLQLRHHQRLQLSAHERPGLRLLAGPLAICRLAAGAEVPAWVGGAFTSVSRTTEELSIVCDQSAVPEGVTALMGRRALVVDGPLEAGLVGLLAELTTVLADALVPVFVVSTYDTDVVLVAEDRLAEALEALGRAGYAVASE